MGGRNELNEHVKLYAALTEYDLTCIVNDLIMMAVMVEEQPMHTVIKQRCSSSRQHYCDGLYCVRQSIIDGENFIQQVPVTD